MVWKSTKPKIEFVSIFLHLLSPKLLRKYNKPRIMLTLVRSWKKIRFCWRHLGNWADFPEQLCPVESHLFGSVICLPPQQAGSGRLLLAESIEKLPKVARILQTFPFPVWKRERINLRKLSKKHKIQFQIIFLLEVGMKVDRGNASFTSMQPAICNLQSATQIYLHPLEAQKMQTRTFNLTCLRRWQKCLQELSSLSKSLCV